MKKYSGDFLDFIRSLDAYGIPIQMKYKGFNSFKTLLGATLTLMVGIVMISTIVFKCSMMYYNQETKTYK